MKDIEAISTIQSPAQAADTSKFKKSQSLRLEKQTIRTLTGAELHLVGGGKCDGSLGSCPIGWTFLSIL